MVRDFRLLLKATFHWKYANWAIALAGGGALTAALSAKFTLAYGFTFLTAFYSIGCWLTSDTLEMKRHSGKYIYQPNNRYAEVPNPAFVWWRAIPTCLMLVAFAAPMFYIRSLQINKDLESLDGWLYPMSDIINGSCQPDHPTTGVMIEVGTNIIEADQFPYSVISVNCDSVLSIDRDKSRRIGITATVRDREGRVVVAIDHGKFAINGNNTFRVKRQDRSTLLVLDELNNEVLYLQMVSINHLVLRAIIYDPRLLKPLRIIGATPFGTAQIRSYGTCFSLGGRGPIYQLGKCLVR